MAIETKDILGWLITGSLGGVGLILNLLTRRDAKRKAKREKESIWSLRLSNSPTTPGDACFALCLEDAAEQRLRLIKIDSLRPRGVEIADVKYETDGAGRYFTQPATFTTQIKIDRDLTGDVTHGMAGLRQEAQATILFFARVPRRKNRPAARERLVVKLQLEAISARGERQTIRVRSEPIAWSEFHAVEDALLEVTQLYASQTAERIE